MASHPPTFATCCTGVKHEGEPKGKLIKLEDSIGAYVSGDISAAADRVLLYLPDVFGIECNNAKLIADSYAEKGLYVVAVDTFNGDALEWGNVPPDAMTTWFPKYGPETVDPVVQKAYDAIVKQYKPKEIFAVGYCFGARYAIRLLGKKGSLAAAAVAHPSFVQLEEIKAIKGPLLISAAEEDTIYTPELRAETNNALKEIGADYFTTLASGVSHGFAVRGDLNDKRVVAMKEKAFTDSLWWFQLHSSSK